ncbi:hypothetical protein H671_2g5178 [Cricetulus griseus]|nr:hypothetical protein H671_2g5178 [Cricetulus griseus]
MSLAPDVDFVSELGNSVKEISRRERSASHNRNLLLFSFIQQPLSSVHMLAAKREEGHVEKRKQQSGTVFVSQAHFLKGSFVFRLFFEFFIYSGYLSSVRAYVFGIFVKC